MMQDRIAFHDATMLWIDKITTAVVCGDEDLATMAEIKNQLSARLLKKKVRTNGALHMLMQWPLYPYKRKSMQRTAMLDMKENHAWIMYGFVAEPIKSWSDHHIILSWRKTFRREEEFSDRSDKYTNVDGYVEYVPAMAELHPADDGIHISMKARIPGSRLIEVFHTFPPRQRAEPVWAQQLRRRQDALAQTQAMAAYLAVQHGEKEPQYRLPPPVRCDLCGEAFAEREYLVDGRVGSGLRWADMCVDCFAANGGVIGWGSGQLYEKQSDGRWLLVGGFPPEEESYGSD